ncbi:MAG: hypothetical protein V4463_01095 [Pseudomonadota bacterium]
MLRPLCFALAALLTAPAWSHDARINHYSVTVDAGAKRIHIDADVWVDGNALALFNATPIAQYKNGQADLLENLAVRDMAGQAIAVKDKGEGEYDIIGERRVRLSYDVRMEHDKVDWPPGNEEVAYHTEEGLMVTGYTLFIVPGDKMPGATEVRFHLPAGWKANTPWRASGAAHTFTVGSRRELVSNALFLGTAHAETFTSGGVELTLVMGKRYWPQRALFMELIERQLKSYLVLFGAPPLAGRYLIVINQGDTGDGGAFSGSFSQYLKTDANAETRVIWGHVLAHELCHFWNGLSLVPAEDSMEWFKEGVTDYLTVTAMARNGVASRDFLLQYLENLPRGQVVARQLMGLKPTVREAVKDKHRNWLLVYGGGTLAALAMDVELRKASQGKTGLPDLVKALYGEFGKPGKTYTQADVVRIGKALTGADLGPVLEPIVGSTSTPKLEPLFGELGMHLEQFGMLEAYLLRASNGTETQHQRFIDIFGMKY